MKTILVLFLGVVMGAEALAIPHTPDDNSDQALWMIDKQNGWKLCETDSTVDVFHTNDGGGKWIKVSPALLTNLSRDDLAAEAP